jgi:hypothetical protein
LGISRTIAGLYDRCACDTFTDWEWGEGYPYTEEQNETYCALGAGFCFDTAEKVEGTASYRYGTDMVWGEMRPFLETPGRTARDYNLGPAGGGALFRVWVKCAGTSSGFFLYDCLSADAYHTYWGGGEELAAQQGVCAWKIVKHTMIEGGNKRIYRTRCQLNESYFDESTWWDDIVICKSETVTVTELVEGQKVELYRAIDSVKIDDATCAAGQTSVDLDIADEHFPEQMYMKVYGTNGTTLLETTASYSICGGDAWEWYAEAGTMTLTRDDFLIYRIASGVLPKSTSIVANLKTPAGANYPNALITFSAVKGTVSPSSDTTDSNGNAHTTLNSLTTVFGLAVVKAQWLGDANVPACSTYIVVHVFYDAEAPDADVGFQLYVEGYPLEFVSGKYGMNGQGTAESFEVEIPEWDDNITPFGLVSIYRKGMKEFAGVYLTPDRHLSDAPRVTLRGLDQTFLLIDRVVDLKIYSGKTPAYIVNDLLTCFDSGINPGSLESSSDTLTITITSETLLAGIQRVCDAVCWDFRMNLDRTVDIAENFSGLPSGASFTEGIDIFDLDATSDLSKIANWIRMVGDGIVSTKQDGTNIMAQGMHQLPSFQTSISSQSTLDIACQALLDLLKDCSETEVLLAYDAYAPGTFDPEDTMTVTAPSVDMAGEYQIKRIERDMTDANFVLLELSNRLGQYWELDETYRRMIKDLSVS